MGQNQEDSRRPLYLLKFAQFAIAEFRLQSYTASDLMCGAKAWGWLKRDGFSSGSDANLRGFPMTKTLLAILAASAATIVAAPAQAVVILADSATVNGPFDITFDFFTSGSGVVDATVQSTDATLNFFDSSVFLGVPFGSHFSIGPIEYLISTGKAVSGVGPFSLEVIGTTTALSAFTVNVSFTPTSTVPEAATWAMMILGMGVIGATLRSSAARPALRRLAVSYA